MPNRQRIAILGLGLIGSSLARALAQKQPGTHISGFDLSHEALSYATAEGLIHSQHAHAGQASHEADIVVLATPPAVFSSLAADIAPFLKPGAIVTDAGSVKRHAIGAIAPHIPEHAYYVPGHPIAGSEQSGVTAGKADLFAGRRVILTPEEDMLLSRPVAQVRALWEATGAHVEFMPAELHDRIYAYVSHLPQLVAFASNTGRLAKSSPVLWAEICMANADYIGQALSDFSDFALQIEGELSETPTEAAEANGNTDELFSQVIATCLIATASLLQELTGVHPARYAGSGFANMTAPATSDPEAALKAISSHHKVIAALLNGTLVKLHRMMDALDRMDSAALIKAMQP